jgi:hypothetical protein
MTPLVFTERILEERLLCSLRVTNMAAIDRDPALICVEHCAEWLFDETIHGHSTTLHDLHEVFDHHWKQTRFFKETASANPKLYNRVILAASRGLRRLRDILCQCEIIQPIEDYHLDLGGVTITGRYSILRSARAKRRAIILYLRNDDAPRKPLAAECRLFCAVSRSATPRRRV